KLALHQRVAEIHLHKRSDPQRAIAAYMAALEAKPDARPVMLELVELLTTTKQWKHAVAILSRLAELDEGSARAHAGRRGQHLALRARQRRRRRGCVRPRARRRSGGHQDVRAHRKGPDREPRLEDPGALLPTADQAPGE